MRKTENFHKEPEKIVVETPSKGLETGKKSSEYNPIEAYKKYLSVGDIVGSSLEKSGIPAEVFFGQSKKRLASTNPED